MGKLGRVSALCALLLACGGESQTPARGGPRAERLERVALEKLAQPVDSRFDAQGKLKPSGRRFAWLELPMGFTEVPGNTDRDAAYEASDMPFEVVRDYFDSRLTPTQVDLGRRNFQFVLAKPSYTQLAMDPVDVTLYETDPDRRGVRVQLKLHLSAVPPVPTETAKELLARERLRAQ